MSFPFKTRPGLIALYVAGLALAGFWIMAGVPRNWATTLPDDVHTYGIRFSRDGDLFFRPWIGWVIERGFTICLAIALLAVTVEVAARLSRRPR